MSFAAIMRAELFRLTRSRSGRIGLVVPALLGVAQVLLADLLAGRAAVREVATGAHPPVAEVVTAFGPLADGVGGLAAMALVLIALLVGTFALVRERDQCSLPLLVLARPRGAVVLGKAVATCLYVIVAFAALFVAAFAAAALGHDFTAIVEDGYVMASAGEQWLETARAVAAGIPALLCCACFGLFVSSIATSVGAAAVAAIVPFTLLALFQSTLGAAADKLFITYAPFFSEHAPLTRFAKVARAFSDTHWESGELARAALVPSGEAVLFLLLAWVATRRRAA